MIHYEKKVTYTKETGDNLYNMNNTLLEILLDFNMLFNMLFSLGYYRISDEDIILPPLCPGTKEFFTENLQTKGKTVFHGNVEITQEDVVAYIKEKDVY